MKCQHVKYKDNLHRTFPNFMQTPKGLKVNSHLLVDGYKLTSTFINFNKLWR